jgi:hypothetical protein
MCIFVVSCVDETYYFMCEYSHAIKLPKWSILKSDPHWAGVTD